jgi:sec-independent protein translocase protein TatA
MPSSLGPAEILVILVVALIVLGPTRLPEAGRQVGKALSEIRKWTQDMKSEVTDAFQPEPPMAPMPPSPVTPVGDPMTTPASASSDAASPPTATPPPPQTVARETAAAETASEATPPVVPALSDAPTAPIEEALLAPLPLGDTVAPVVPTADGDGAIAPPTNGSGDATAAIGDSAAPGSVGTGAPPDGAAVPTNGATGANGATPDLGAPEPATDGPAVILPPQPAEAPRPDR